MDVTQNNETSNFDIKAQNINQLNSPKISLTDSTVTVGNVLIMYEKSGNI